ncbi:hypothetical protein SI65_04545 [Aspergillus cristatus]|uniref:Uncharacterized protein n=1 Tax=Aspergillus cristatus TaxID=573508 RepID=A0A1E3BF12_ASPCR|nr:hypothetical protein SI65_04545 [Aspergillus cristatus]
MESAISDRGNSVESSIRLIVGLSQSKDARTRTPELLIKKTEGTTGPVKYADAKWATCDKAFWVNRYMVDPDGPENSIKNWRKTSLCNTYEYLDQSRPVFSPGLEPILRWTNFTSISESISLAKKIESNGQPYNATGRLVGHTCITFV